MGVDIQVFEVKEVAGKPIQSCVAQDYLSGNFYSPYWNIHEEMDGQKGKQVAENIRVALEIFRNEGYETGKPDLYNTNWAWGQKDNISFDNNTIMGVFMFHLERFLKLAETYPDCYFLSDNDCTKDSYDATIVLPSGNLYTIKYFDSDESDSYAIAYFRHPIKGNFRVDSQQKCLEVFGILSALGDPRAQAWFNIHKQFKP